FCAVACDEVTVQTRIVNSTRFIWRSFVEAHANGDPVPDWRGRHFLRRTANTTRLPGSETTAKSLQRLSRTLQRPLRWTRVLLDCKDSAITKSHCSAQTQASGPRVGPEPARRPDHCARR